MPLPDVHLLNRTYRSKLWRSQLASRNLCIRNINISFHGSSCGSLLASHHHLPQPLQLRLHQLQSRSASGKIRGKKTAEKTTLDPNYTEVALSKLEGRASLICRRIENAQQTGRSTFSLTRSEKDDVLRKFLYIMLYRSGIFRDKYYMNIEDYQGGDKSQIVAFMEKKGFKTLKQVWAHHLRIILDTRIDVEGTWKNIVREEMVPDNATHYIERITNCFLSVVQPESNDDEFILTENGFAIFEGNASWNTPTGYQFYVYHCLAPIAPRLMLVLRDNMLRTELKPRMKRMRRVGVKTGAVPRFPSLLEDLPVSPPKTSCCESQTFTENDQFLFEIAKISTRHIHKMHGIMLSEARKSVTFLSNKSAAASVESWLEDRGTLPSRENPNYDMLIKLRQRKRGLLELLRPDIHENPSEGGGLPDKVREQQKSGRLALLQPDIHQHLPLGDHPARMKENQVFVRQIKLEDALQQLRLERNGIIKPNDPPGNRDEKPQLTVIGDIRPRREPLPEDECKQYVHLGSGVIAGKFLPSRFLWSCGGD
ncbi:hypothetical protein BDD12DRAFT_817171 [Trichophaea hybrida]|nr:hypothetical protein BDD12DRAFT_817171 [Trichophaea hybrida]